VPLVGGAIEQERILQAKFHAEFIGAAERHFGDEGTELPP